MPRADLHGVGEERSLAMHRLIADLIGRDEAVLVTARARVARWLESGTVHRDYAEAWRAALEGPRAALVALLTDRGERATALRQASPFAGALDARTRWAIHREVGRRDHEAR